MVTFRDYTKADRDWVFAVNTRHYREVEGFDESFTDAVTAALDHLEASGLESPNKYLVAEDRGKPIGCVFFEAHPDHTGRIRLFYLDQAYRGQGVGRRTVEVLIDHARTQSVERLLVSTFDKHDTACRLYAAMGFEATRNPVGQYFGQEMAQVDFELGLRGDA